MKTPLSWIKKFLPTLEKSPEEIAELLTVSGLEVDRIESLPLSFSGVVTALVVDVTPHPEADHLVIASVFDGVETLQLVCGAKNCRKGLKTALARIGAELKDPEGKSWKIKKSKLRGVESYGMLCSSSELGLSSDDEGIIEFAEEILPGTDLVALYSDPILEISLTPNLGHALSVLGIARELSALLNIPLQLPVYTFEENSAQSINSMIQVQIEEPELCPRYTCRIIEGIPKTESPAWLKSRLEMSGLKSIHILVDCANYIMLESGQPLHVFDYDKICGKKISVRSGSSEKMAALDDQSYVLPESALLICDVKKPIAIAGVMGSRDSGVSETTETICIESAYFKPESVRKSSKLLGIKSDAAYRFERGIDKDLAKRALDDVTGLIQSLTGGKVVTGAIDTGSFFEPKNVVLRKSRTNQILGTNLSLGEIESYLTRLCIEVKEKNEESLVAQIPSFRGDLHQEIDLIEEVARIYGYQNIQGNPPRYTSSTLPHSPIYLFENQIRSWMLQAGLQEWITCDLISPDLATLTTESPLKNHLISVLHPSSIDQSILRPTLLASILPCIQHNLAHQNLDIAAFEIGRVHLKENEAYQEPSCVGILLSGSKAPQHWGQKSVEFDFFDLKGIVENLTKSLRVGEVQFETSHLHNFHPGRQARLLIKEIQIGVIGELHPSHMRTLGIEQRLFFAELNLTELLSLPKKEKRAEKINTFPGSIRDWTLSLDENTPVGKILSLVNSVPSRFLESVQLLDLYKSDQIGKNKKNATFRFFYRDQEKTISVESVEKEHARIIERLLCTIKEHI